MSGLFFIFGVAAMLSGAVILDRIAVIAGTHVIKTSDIEQGHPAHGLLESSAAQLQSQRQAGIR